MPKQSKDSKKKNAKSLPQKRSSLADKIKGFYILIRPRYTLFVALVAFAGMFVPNGKISTAYLLPLFVITLHYMAICIKDDIEDYEVDLKLDKGRPLVKSLVSIKEAYTAWISMHLLALPLALFVSVKFFALMAVYITIGVLYAQKPFRISDRGIWGNLFFSWFSVQLPFLGGVLAVDKLDFRIFTISLLLWIWVFIVDLLKDFLLADHNRLETRISFVMQLGIVKASKLYSLFSLIYIIVYPLVFWMFGLNIIYFGIASFVAVWLLIVTVQLLRSPTNHPKLLIRSYFALPPLIVISFIFGSL